MSGSTLVALQSLTSGGGVNLQFVAQIEGLNFLLSDGASAATLTAYAADAEFSAATVLPGLGIKWGSRQSMTPWETTIDPMRVSLCIPPEADRTDAFGKLVFGAGAGFSTKLTTPGGIDSNDTTITVLSTSTFPSSGSIHIGTEHITYTGKTATTFTGCTRGRYAPLKANTEANQRFGRAHPLSVIGDGLVVAPTVSSLPRVMAGRMVAIYAHRVIAGVLDVKAEAQLVFAGRITSVRDEPTGLTWFDCVDVRQAINDCVLMSDQWTAQSVTGIYLQDGWVFDAEDVIALTGRYANALTVSDSPGAGEIASGYYSLSQLADALNTWFAAERTAGRLGLKIELNPEYVTQNGIRARFSFSAGSDVDDNSAKIKIPVSVLEMLGHPNNDGNYEVNFDDVASFNRDSPEEPYQTYLPANSTITVTDVRGTWFNNQGYAPAQATVPTTAGSSYAILQMDGGSLIVAKYISATSIEWVNSGSPGYFANFGPSFGSSSDFGFNMRRVSEAGSVRFKQVALISGDLATLMTRLLASTGTAAYNHATYDVFPAQLGAAIPWQVLGDNWVNSIATVATDVQMTLFIDKPTKLTEALGGDLALSLGTFIWKDQCIRATTWATPVSTSALWSFTEGNKAITAEATDHQRTVTDETDDFFVNQIKLEYNRSPDGGYKTTDILMDKDSQFAHGRTRSVTISLRNHYSGIGDAEGAIESARSRLAAAMGMFSRPLRILRRTLSPQHFEAVAPGDVCTVTDLFARDPLTGTRGLTTKAGLIVSIQIDWGGWEPDSETTRQPSGTVDILILPRSNVVAYCPCAQLVLGAGGYDAGTKTVTFEAHQHSESTAAVDVSHFAAGDKVNITEIDPDNPAAPQTWADTIVSVNAGANTCVLTTGLAGFSSTLYYRMLSQRYTNATTTQQAKVYQADDADGMIEDTINSYEYGLGSNAPLTWAADAAGTLPALYAESSYGDGYALDVGYERDIARLCNSLQNYRTSPVLPRLYRNILGATGVCVRRIVAVEPMHVGPGLLDGGVRYLYIAPWLRSSTGASVKLRISLCRHPPSGSSLTMTDADAPQYALTVPYEQQEYTVSSTTWAVGATTTLSISPALVSNGLFYLVYETEQFCETRGLSLCQFGAYVL